MKKLWWLNEESEQILNRGYLLKGETVQGAIERIATAASQRLYKPELKDAFIQLIENGWMSLSSPVWANMGTKRGLPCWVLPRMKEIPKQCRDSKIV